MKFVALAAIVRFDSMYSSGLYEDKIKKLIGKVLPIEYKRHMIFMTCEEREA